MRIRHILQSGVKLSAVALFLAGVQASAQDMPPADAGAPVSLPAIPPAPDARLDWRDAPAPVAVQPAALQPAALQVDPRAREAWLAECRRRTDRYYDDGDHRGSKDRREAWRNDRGYDYCEAYFDDYYRHYAQAGYGHHAMVPGGHAGHGMMHARPMAMQMVPVAAQSRGAPECTETVENVYEDVPVRRRVIYRAPRRTPDKRVRITPSKRVRIN